MKKAFITFAVLGFVGAVVSEVTPVSEVMVSYIVGAVEFIIWIALIPVIASKAKKLRVQNSTSGFESVRTAGWLIYWLSLANGVMLFQWGVWSRQDSECEVYYELYCKSIWWRAKRAG